MHSYEWKIEQVTDVQEQQWQTNNNFETLRYKFMAI